MHALTLYNQYARRVFGALLAALVLCLALYAALLLGAIAYAAGEAQAANEVKALSAQIGSLEADYLALTRALSPERATALGLVRPQQQFVVYASSQEGLTLR